MGRAIEIVDYATMVIVRDSCGRFLEIPWLALLAFVEVSGHR